MKPPTSSHTSKSLYEMFREIGHSSGNTGRFALVGALERLAGGYACNGDRADRAIRSVLKDHNGIWHISEMYWRLRRMEATIAHGLVFTPPELADSVVTNLMNGLPVVDLGAGTGMLSIAAARRGFHVTAVEQDPEMACVLSSLAEIEGVADYISVVIGDALDYTTDCPSQIMSNPPYTRHHSLSDRDKRALLRLSETLGTPLRGSAGHYAYFMLYAWKALWSRREVLLIPTNWLEAKYGQPLRDYLTSEKDFVVASVGHSDGRSAFQHALTTSCILTTTAKRRELSRVEGPIVSRLSSCGSASVSNDATAAPNLRLLGGRQSHQEGITVGNILRVRRGIATGANDLFVVSLEDNEALNLPMDELVPILRKLKDYENRQVASFLWVPKAKPSKPSLQRIRYGQKLQYHRRTLCMTRTPWWQLSIPNVPRYLLSYMGRHRPTILRNHRGLLNLNNIHGVNPIDGVAPDIADRVVDWLSSTDGQNAILDRARRYQGGLWKIEPGDMHGIVVPPSLSV